MAVFFKDEGSKRVERRDCLRQLLGVGALGAGLPLAGCGTLMHSERVHRHHSRDLDWKIVALNGLGLALFFIPGVVAFVVDFHTGAIYLPPEHQPVRSYRPSGQAAAERHAAPAPASLRPRAASAWSPIRVPSDELVPDGIASIVADRVGAEVSLLAPQVRVSELAGLDQFDRQRRRHQSDPGFGHAARAFFGLAADPDQPA